MNEREGVSSSSCAASACLVVNMQINKDIDGFSSYLFDDKPPENGILFRCRIYIKKWRVSTGE